MNLDYTGLEISDLSVLEEFLERLPSNISSTIGRHLEELRNSDTAAQIAALRKLINCLRTQKPKSFDEYIGYVAFTSAITLIKIQHLRIEQNALISHLFDSSVYTDHLDDDLAKMYTTAHVIWKVCASRLDNVRHIATIYGIKNKFAYVTSILLLSAAMNTTTEDEDDQPKVFCMVDLPRLLNIMNQLNSIEDLNKRLEKLHQFLVIYSVYQSLVFLREPKHEVSELLEPCFAFNEPQLREFEQLLRNLLAELNVHIRKFQHAEWIGLNDIIEYIILPGLEELLEKTLAR